MSNVRTLSKKDPELFSSPFAKGYWSTAAAQLGDLRMLILAALLIAIRVVLKSVAIPIAENLSVYVGFFVNALGAMVFGPIVALLGGAVSDTVGAILFPSGGYFFPFIFVEMLGSFIYGLFLWRRKFTALRVIICKFTVTVICNLILNPIIMVWYYAFLNNGKTYALVTLPRIIKNLVLFPAEAALLVIFLTALLPALKQLRLIPSEQEKPIMKAKHYIIIAVLVVIAAALIILWPILGNVGKKANTDLPEKQVTESVTEASEKTEETEAEETEAAEETSAEETEAAAEEVTEAATEEVNEAATEVVIDIEAAAVTDTSEEVKASEPPAETEVAEETEAETVPEVFVDLDGDDKMTNADALFDPEKVDKENEEEVRKYDFDGNGVVDEADREYLLRSVLLGQEYFPIAGAE